MYMNIYNHIIYLDLYTLHFDSVYLISYKFRLIYIYIYLFIFIFLYIDIFIYWNI